MPLVKVKDKHQITIPAEVRKKLGVKIGDYLLLEEQGDAIVLKPAEVIERGKKEAWERLRVILERVHARIGDVPEDQVERDVLEAIQAMRKR